MGRWRRDSVGNDAVGGGDEVVGGGVVFVEPGASGTVGLASGATGGGSVGGTDFAKDLLVGHLDGGGRSV